MIDPGTLIREARLAAGLSQAELARRAQVSQPMVSAYEHGRREPGLTTLAKLVDAAGHELEVSLRPKDGAASGLPPTPMGRRLRRRRRAILAAAGARGVSNVRVFGSVARGEDGEGSDIDLLVDVDEGVGLLALLALERELSALLGRTVDVVPESGLKARVRPSAIEDAIPL